MLFNCKLATPFGQMPLLEVDGKQVHQSLAIVRYIAKRVGLAGSNDWESLLIDSVGDTANDLRLSGFAHLFFCESQFKNVDFYCCLFPIRIELNRLQKSSVLFEKPMKL